YCVTSVPLSSCLSGSKLTSGWSPMTTPAAWTEALRVRSSRMSAVSINSRDGLAAIFLADIFNDIGPPVVGEINVNIRWVDALGIEEALEEQAVTDRVHV